MQKKQTILVGNVLLVVCLLMVLVILFGFRKTLEQNNKFLQNTITIKEKITTLDFLLHETLYSEKPFQRSYQLFLFEFEKFSTELHPLTHYMLFNFIQIQSNEIETSRNSLWQLIQKDQVQLNIISRELKSLSKKIPPDHPGPNNVRATLNLPESKVLLKIKSQLEGLTISQRNIWNQEIEKFNRHMIELAEKVKKIIEWTTFTLLFLLIFLVIAMGTAFQKIYMEQVDLSSNLKDLVISYGRFVPQEFLGFLNKTNIIHVELGDQIEKEMTVFFSEIKEFSKLSEILTPEQNFKFINSYLSRMQPIINKNKGVVDKYIGDSIMALFPEKVDDAVQCAIDMLREIQVYNLHRKNSGYQPIHVGIGLHTGSLMLGTIGGKDRMDGTVISDSVNLASRVEVLTKNVGASLLMTEISYSKMIQPLSENQVRYIGKIKVKGKESSIRMLEVLEGLEPKILEMKLATKKEFEFALELFSLFRLEECQNVLSKIEQKFPGQDKAVQFYYKKCESLQFEEMPKNWAGVVEFI